MRSNKLKACNLITQHLDVMCLMGGLSLGRRSSQELCVTVCACVYVHASVCTGTSSQNVSMVVVR